MNIDATNLHFKDLNDKVRQSQEDICIDNCIGQCFIASGSSNKTITVNGTPGNALGAYLDGSIVYVNGNAQDAVGDTMNEGKIIINGSAGDALGYAMRGGEIYVKGNAGYRTGIHMKQYKDKKPIIVVGGEAGSFLGEYQAGGLLIVLGIGAEGKIPVGNFTGTGMHGGYIFIRCDEMPKDLPVQVSASVATKEDLKQIEHYINEFAEHFGVDTKSILNSKFHVLIPNASNPYKQMYTTN